MTLGRFKVLSWALAMLVTAWLVFGWNGVVVLVNFATKRIGALADRAEIGWHLARAEAAIRARGRQ